MNRSNLGQLDQEIRLIVTFILLLLVSASAGWAQVNPEYLSRDEGLGLDRIALQFSEVCSPATDSRTMGLGIDKIRFLDAGGEEVFLVDVGNTADRHWLGEGWHGDETWGDERTVCWTDGLSAKTYVNCPIPPTASAMEIVATIPPCVTAITTEVTINAQAVGDFDVIPTNVWLPRQLTLPDTLKDVISYRLELGGPVTVSSIDWIDGDGFDSEYDLLDAELGVPGAQVDKMIQVPSDAGDFRLNFEPPVPTTSTLEMGVNGLSTYWFTIPSGATSVDTFLPDALERQADRRVTSDGWGESFDGSATFRSWTGPGPDVPSITWTHDTMVARLPEGEQVFFLHFLLPEPLSIEDYPYLSIKLKATSGFLYYIRPVGLNGVGQPVPIWHESAATDDRYGTGNWETLTIDLEALAAESETGGVSVTEILIPAETQKETTPGTVELDWIRIHDGFAPNSADVTDAEILGDHLDNDLDGLVDKQDTEDAQAQYFDQPMVFAHYHPWYGSPFSTTGHWAGWYSLQTDYTGPSDEKVPPTGVVYDPDDFVEGIPGKRNICSRWYPLNFWDCPDYQPPADGQYQYDLYGGVEHHDSLNLEYVRREVELAAQYGIDGFAADTGGPGSLVGQIKTTLEATLSQPEPFLMTVLYDWYYGLAAWGLEEKEDYQIAFDIMYMLGEYASHPNWFHYQGRPVLTAPFLSHLVAANKWVQVARIVVDPTISDYGGAVVMPRRGEGFDNTVEFNFAKAEKPDNGDPRTLAVRFKYIEFLDADFERVGYLDIGQPDVRPHLLGGWSGDEGNPDVASDETWVWAMSPELQSSLEIEIPADAAFMSIHCHSLPDDNSMTISVNDSAPVSIDLKGTGTNHLLRLREAGDSPVVPGQVDIPDPWPFALFMDHQSAAPLFDGYASYGGYLRCNRVVISETGPTILTVGVGYDDRKIRVPGNYTDREDGALYRRNWETALSMNPDLIFLNTWNEWPESTNISPTVEFGFTYLELTLTYSLIYKKKMETSALPSEMGLTLRQYEVDGNGGVSIRLRSEQAGQVTLRDLPLGKTVPGKWTVTRDQAPYADFTIDEAAGTLVLNMASGGDYEIQSDSSNAVGHLGSWLTMP